MRRVKLRTLAHARSGDKGDTCNIGVVARDARAYALLREHLTTERVRAYFHGLVAGEVLRYELPNVGALNFVLRGALGGGGTRSMRLDAIGRALADALLELELALPDA